MPKTKLTKKENEEKKDIIGSANEELEVHQIDENWFEAEGQLAIDVYQTAQDFYIQTTVAGVKSDDLEISIDNDMVTIKGRRERLKDFDGLEKECFLNECFWGPFSRQIILPSRVNASGIEASIKEGILTIKLPKVEEKKNKKIRVKT